ncbi:uncharacterized protein I206_107290 [Kwoniella pini CBS 10737]|uniref:Transmembrane protein n=1 Tax=Kwoniella pini CBS 10737 TaxID=1296096 RepID=A0A1B9HYM4_9TREE|nr:uncharacterized protein I206_05166 [Kwoniella pini CBS 10737]OCF48389.1 hypothetical protein I206_05166 [Kwoniella pini CBS 10737]
MSNRFNSKWQFLDYNQTQVVPYPPIFHLLSVILAFLAFAIIALWAAATVGYEPSTIFDTDINRTDDKHWFTTFIPRKIIESEKGKLCESAMFPTGSSLMTNAQFPSYTYTIIRYNRDPLYRLAVAEYRGSNLSVCAIDTLKITVKMVSGVVGIAAEVQCPEPWPAQLYTSINLDPGEIWAKTNLQDLALDLLSRLKVIFDSGQYTNNTTKGKWTMLNLILRDMTLNALEEDPNHRLQTVPPLTLNAMRLSNAEDSTWNGTSSASGAYYGRPPEIYNDFVIPLTNFIQVFISSIYSDLGIREGNIYANLTTLNQLINAKDNVANTSILGPKDLINTKELLSNIPINPYSSYSDLSIIRNNASVATAYLCHVTKLKSPADWIDSVAGLTLSIWGGLWTTYMLVVSYLSSRKAERMTDQTSISNDQGQMDKRTAFQSTSKSDTIDAVPLLLLRTEIPHPNSG